MARAGLLLIGVAFGSISWVLFAYAAATLLSSTLSRHGAVVYGGALIIEAIGIVWGLSNYRRPASRLATALGVAGWTCAVINFIILNVYHAVL